LTAESARYSGRVRGLFRELPASGPLTGGTAGVTTGEAVALDRGAWVRFEARCDGGRIVECRFRAWGCPHTLAAAALAATRLSAGTEAPAEAIAAIRLAGELGVPAEKMGRLLVVEDAGRELLENCARVQ